MKRLLILSLIIFSTLVFARGEENKAYKYWDEGTLDWTDFQDSLRLKGGQSDFHAFLRVDKAKTYDGNIRTIRPEARACFDRYHSFAEEPVRNESMLRLFQAEYDLLEAYRRRLQTELNLGTIGIDADNRMDEFMDVYSEQCRKMVLETDSGKNEIKLQEWEFYVAKELEKHPAPSVPRIVPRRFGYGFYLGTGVAFSAGKTADYWDPAWQIHVGFDLAYVNTHLLGEFSAGRVRTRQDIEVHDGDLRDVWKQDGRNTYTSLSLSIGQQLVSTKHFALMPYAGCIWSAYSDQTKIYDENNKLEKFTLSYANFNWTAGICFDYRFSTTISLVPSFWLGHRETSTVSLRTKLFINQERYKDFDNIPGNNLRGYKLGFSVACHGFSRLLQIK